MLNPKSKGAIMNKLKEYVSFIISNSGSDLIEGFKMGSIELSIRISQIFKVWIEEYDWSKQELEFMNDFNNYF